MRFFSPKLLAALLITGAMTPMTLTIAGCKNSPQQAGVTNQDGSVTNPDGSVRRSASLLAQDRQLLSRVPGRRPSRLLAAWCPVARP